MAIRVHGSSFVGEKLVGNLDFFTVTVWRDATNGIPFGNTGVAATRTELVGSGELANATLSATNSISIVHPTGAYGDVDNVTVTYTTNAAYDTAYVAQKNLDLLVQTISQKAQPVLMSDIVNGTAGSNLFKGGTDGNGDAIGTFKFAVEHTATFANAPAGSGNPLAADAKAVGLAYLLGQVGDALRAAAGSFVNTIVIAGVNVDTFNTNVAGSLDNVVINFFGTL